MLIILQHYLRNDNLVGNRFLEVGEGFRFVGADIAVFALFCGYVLIHAVIPSHQLGKSQIFEFGVRFRPIGADTNMIFQTRKRQDRKGV